MYFKSLFFAFLISLICVYKSNQQAANNLFNASTQYILFESLQQQQQINSNKTWAVLVAGSAGWDNYR